MKLNIHSISFRLICIALLSVTIPLLAIGILAVSRSTSAFTHAAAENTRDVARDLASLVDNMLTAEIRLTAIYAADETTVDLARALADNDSQSVEISRKRVFESLKKQFERMGSNYQGIFMADQQGNIFTGILADGREYRGISIATNPDFIRTKQTGESFAGKLLRSAATGELILPVISPIVSENGQFIGAFSIIIKADYLTQIVSQRTFG
ncbi:PDC sensor domain-containing protein [Desulfobotulus mexicanus]|uniref:Cache domain-containing protein n=1 Tax=Desulfobotulus mexicanus TaxID=2586642 RepID=A0A5Q4VEK3_9BACT|nr:PDC sensor domain-containing protein [Desulfobotulus mexicanus]TYT76075.1 hypothetical protein FIM25_00530 [Desulfobotulus mexicanus]